MQLARRRHRQLCATCTKLRHDAARWCDAGWQLHKQIRDVTELVAQLAAEAEGQGALWSRSEVERAAG